MKLQANEGPLDRIARIALGVVLIAAGAFGWSPRRSSISRGSSAPSPS